MRAMNIEVYTDDGAVDQFFSPKISKVMEKMGLKSLEEFANHTVSYVYDCCGRNDKLFHSIVELLAYKDLRLKEE